MENDRSDLFVGPEDWEGGWHMKTTYAWNRPSGWLLGWCGLAMAVCSALTASAQAVPQTVPRYGDIPSDSLAVASFDLAELRELHAFRYIPWEIATVACREQFGFELSDVQSIDATVQMPSPMPEVGFSIRLSKPFDIADLTDELLSPIETAPNDKTLRFRDVPDYPMIRIAQKDPQRVIVATQGTMRRMLSQRIQTGGPTMDLLQASRASVRLVLNLSKLRDLIGSLYEQASDSIPEIMYDDIETIIALIDNVMVELAASEQSQLRISFGASSVENAETALEAVNRLRSEGMQIARDSIEEQMQDDPSVSDAMREAVSSYFGRMQSMVNEEGFWSQQNDRIELNMENAMMSNYATVGVMTGLLLPAVQAAREAARRMASANNLKQMMLSLLNYEAAQRVFPPRAKRDSEGQPLLSWRVMILPYLEEAELYNEFHLDEPWDSQHNLALLDRMPPCFNNPRVPGLMPGYTVYQAAYGQDIGWPDEALRFAQITDGSSNTIALVETTGELAVPWTKPDDLDLDLHPIISWMPRIGANVAFFDGSVSFLSSSIDGDVLRAFFTKDGGELVTRP